MTTYAKADKQAKANMAHAMKRYHPELRDAEVSVDLLLAYGPRDANGDLVSPALTSKGLQCLGKIRVLGLKDRVAGRGDAEMLLDGDQIDEWSDEELAAIIDHELTHLELQVADDGTVKRDDIDRPKLRIRPHDREYGWFDSVARRHPEHSVEVRQARQLLDEHDTRQLYLPGFEAVA